MHLLEQLDPGTSLGSARPKATIEDATWLPTVGNYGRTASLYNLLSQAGRFGLSAGNARKEIDQIVAVARQWRESFFACGVSAQDLDYIAPAILPECFFFERPPGE